MKARLFIILILMNLVVLCQAQSQDSIADTCSIEVPQFVRSSCPPANGYPIKYNCKPDTFQLKIYDRWGNLVFETTDIDIFWQGEASISNDSTKNLNVAFILPQGTYFYILDAKFIARDEILNTGYLQIKR